NLPGQDRGDRQADQGPKERQLDLPLLGGRDRREEERGESFGEDPKFHLRDHQGDEDEGGEHLDSEDERVRDDVGGTEGEEPAPSGPSSMRAPGEEQEDEIGEEGQSEGRDPTAVGDGEEVPGDPGFEEGQGRERRPPQSGGHEARRGQAATLRSASARGAAGAGATSWARRRSGA